MIGVSSATSHPPPTATLQVPVSGLDVRLLFCFTTARSAQFEVALVKQQQSFHPVKEYLNLVDSGIDMPIHSLI